MGPLAGCRVVELAGIGPGPFAGMILADLGAEVVRVDRPGGGLLLPAAGRFDLLNRGKKSVLLDLKRPADVQTALGLVARADVLIEGYRPGVAERLGVGPHECLARNPALVYGRMTGWGQDGPLAGRAGHDIAYIALTGALHAIGEAGGPPQIPLNLLGDFGGGGAYLVIGVLAALWAVRHGAPGQVVDAAIVDGTAHLLALTHGLLAAGGWTDERGVNLLDGGAPFYSIYATSDGRHMAVGALESKFYAELLDRLGVDEDPARQHDRAGWPALRERIEAEFAQKNQAEWSEIFAGSGRVRRAGAEPAGGGRAPAPEGPRHVRHPRRHPPAVTRAPVLRHRRGARRATAAARGTHRGSPAGLGRGPGGRWPAGRGRGAAGVARPPGLRLERRAALPRRPRRSRG